MTMAEMLERAKSDFSKLTNCRVEGITGCSRSDNGWAISLEVVERKGIPDTMDILGVYDVSLDNDGAFVSFERKRLRKRSDTN